MHIGHLDISAITLVIRDFPVLVTHLPREVAEEENKAHSSSPFEAGSQVAQAGLEFIM